MSLTERIVDSIRDRKGRGVVDVDLSAINSTPAAHFIICEGSSSTQVAAIADNIRERLLEEARVKPYGYDGYDTAQWIVLDYGDTLVHVFQRPTRERYNLEELWSDAPITRYPDID